MQVIIGSMIQQKGACMYNTKILEEKTLTAKCRLVLACTIRKNNPVRTLALCADSIGTVPNTRTSGSILLISHRELKVVKWMHHRELLHGHTNLIPHKHALPNLILEHSSSLKRLVQVIELITNPILKSRFPCSLDVAQRIQYLSGAKQATIILRFFYSVY